MATCSLWYFAMGGNTLVEKRALAALAEGEVDRLVVFHAEENPVKAFTAEASLRPSISFVQCKSALGWIGDGLRKSSRKLESGTGADDTVVLTSSALQDPHELSIRQLRRAATDHGITYRTYCDEEFEGNRRRIGLFDELVLHGTVIRDRLFPTFWRNLSLDLDEHADRLYALAFFQEDFRTRHTIQHIFPVAPPSEGAGAVGAAKVSRVPVIGKPGLFTSVAKAARAKLSALAWHDLPAAQRSSPLLRGATNAEKSQRS